MSKRKIDRNSTILTPMTPQVRSYKHEFGQLLTTEAAFTPEECHGIIHEFGDDIEQAAVRNNEDAPEVSDFRKSDICWIPPNPTSFPLMDKLLEIVMTANVRYEFEIDHFEAFQLTRYGVDGHYDWHKDIGTDRAAHRKLSLSVQLSSPDSYEGGELQIMTGGDKNFVALKDQGSVTLFPSWERHRVTPVTKGERWALVTWASGGSRFR